MIAMKNAALCIDCDTLFDASYSSDPSCPKCGSSVWMYLETVLDMCGESAPREAATSYQMRRSASETH